jgi:AsmA protein
MPKAIKYVVIALAALIALLVIAIGIIAATFNPNDYKPQIIKLVQEKTQRTLTIPGEIKLTFFPKIGADLGKVGISEHNSTAEFASVNSAKVSLQLIPLLSKQLVVDKVRIDGLHASITRFKDGGTNFDDLLSKEESKGGPPTKSGQPIKFDVDSMSITNAGLLYDDQQQGRKFEIAKLDLETGKIANGVPSKASLSAHVKGNNPAIDAAVALKTGFTIDLDKQHYVLKGADAEVKGKLLDFSDLVVKAGGDADLKPADKRFALDGVRFAASGKRAGQPIDVRFEAPRLAITDARVSGGKLNGEAKLTEGPRTIMVNFSAPSFEGSPQAFKVPSLALDVAVKDATLDAKAKIAGTFTGDIDKLLFASPQIKLALSGKQGDTALDGALTTPFSANLKTQQVELPNIAAAFNLPNPGGGALKFNAGGKAHADLGKQTASAALKGKLDESAYDAKLGLNKFSPAAYTFDIGIDRLDADRYKSKPAAAAQKKDAPADKKAETPEKPLDLSALKDLNAIGSLRIGALKVENIKASNVRVDLRAGGGKIEMNPLAANLYGGSVNGSMSATASKAPRIAMRQNLVGIHVGPLLKDAIGKEPIEGRGNVQLDVTTQGGTVTQMKKGLNGTARLELRDGSVRGINVAQVIRGAKAKIGAIKGDEAGGGPPPQAGTGSAGEKTDFSELTGSFRIANGVAHNDDLNIKSPLIRVGGAGDINLGDDRLDYLVKATVVSTLQGQGGPELQSLKGLTVPVRLSGPFAAIGWHVDFRGMASELAKQRIDEKKEELRSQAQKALGDQRNKARDQVKEGLKGLFGK